jgi:hypothetical protein
MLGSVSACSFITNVFVPPIVWAICCSFLILVIWALSVRLARQLSARGTKLPFTKRYLRPPGEFLRMELDKLSDQLDSEIIFALGAAGGFGVGVYWLLVGEFVGGTIFLFAALGVFLLLFLRLGDLVDKIADHRLGFLGERAVGEELNQLLADGWSVFHDVPFQDNPGNKPFNVDHVVVGPGGLFAVETKARRKRTEKGGHEVTFDGQLLQYPWGAEPWGLDNARTRADALGAWLSKSLQREVPVIPVLALPGWFVRRKGRSELRVVSSGELQGVFRGEAAKARLDSQIVQAIKALLEARCRDVGLE